MVSKTCSEASNQAFGLIIAELRAKKKKEKEKERKFQVYLVC
jgi:hypothetical protein